MWVEDVHLHPNIPEEAIGFAPEGPEMWRKLTQLSTILKFQFHFHPDFFHFWTSIALAYEVRLGRNLAGEYILTSCTLIHRQNAARKSRRLIVSGGS